MACQVDRDTVEPKAPSPTYKARAGGVVLSRRSLVNKLVAIPVAVAVPTIAPALAAAAIEQPFDPIFAAIKAYRRADAACDAYVARKEDIPDSVGETLRLAFRVVERTYPTTPAGLAALTTWAREQADWYVKNDSLPFAENTLALLSTIDDATRDMAGLKPWSPEIQNWSWEKQADTGC